MAIVTFGQTGSGKTFTLVGPDATFAMSEAEFGVLPRAVRHVFAALKVRVTCGSLAARWGPVLFGRDPIVSTA